MSASSDEQVVNTPEILVYQNEFPENGKKLYLNKKSADVHFLFGEDDDVVTRIPAHKSLLSINSDVFGAMFYGEMMEMGDVHLTDSSEAAFMEFLQYFYLKDVKLTAANIVGVLHLGHKYNVKKCVRDCVQYLVKKIGNENVCEHLRLGILFEQGELIDASEKYIMVNTAEVFQSDGFLACSKDVLAHILKANVLSCTEVDVFHACMKWVKNKCDDDAAGETLSKQTVEKHLGKLFYMIRFASMTMDQLFTLQDQYKSVLTPDFITISKIIVKPGFQTDDFDVTPRHAKWNENAIINCSFKNGNKGACRFPEQMYAAFSVNKPLLLGGFTCGKVYGVENDKKHVLSSGLSVEIDIMEVLHLDDTNARNLLKMTAMLSSTETHILLPHPILVRPGIIYKISIGPFNGNLRFSSEEMKTDVHLQSNIVIQSKFLLRTQSQKQVGLICALDFNAI